MATPDFVLALREKIGHDPIWLVGTTAVLTRGSEILLVKRADSGAWTPVTGIIDPREEPADAAARETLEEADVVAVAERLAWVHTIPRVTYPNGDQADYLDFTFRMRYVSGEPYPADGENTEARWFELDALPPLSEAMRERIDHALADEVATEFVRAS
ncbi:NUDIX hydrolase [Subtercola boreus]|uniref:ADP-ribose pyrophosphatase n=1 Tax=Subtercola boreus TaxID=120213 RepID=A0A3E0WAG8_9MICO|nr:NUDIX domain-containing protein [Subtercola boreus]RFA21022.1 ADP-ribose pyrophosphatase [Subtercola boreus]RFA21406.1 ADP-ribose pyrophosphatase [Subtercola boreus]RFA27377.1 ADP-ribose pyrophosphatase [Subtercola boreus]